MARALPSPAPGPYHRPDPAARTLPCAPPPPDAPDLFRRTLIESTHAAMEDYVARYRAACRLSLPAARERALEAVRASDSRSELLEEYIDAYESGDYDAFIDFFDTLYERGEETPFHPPFPPSD